MPDPIIFYNEQHFISGPSNVPDRVSQDLQRKTLVITLASALGIGIGALCLILGGPKGELVWLGFSALALVSLILLIRFFEVGLVAFLGVCWIAVGTPALAEGGSGGGAQQLKLSQLGLIVLLSIWGMRRLSQLRRGKDNKLYQTPVNVPSFYFLAICIWSTVNSLLFPNTLVAAHGPKQFFVVNILEILLRILALGSVVMIGDTLRGRALRAACVVIALPGALTFTGLLTFLPASHWLAFPQIIAMAVLGAIAIADDKSVRLWVRILCGAISLGILYQDFVKGADWVSGWVGCLVALGLIAFTARRKAFWTGCGAIAVIVLLNFAYFYQNVYVSNFYGAGPTHDRARVGHMGTFTNDRSRMWEAAFKYASEFPIGIGLGNYRSYNMYFGRVDVWNTTTFTSAHGTYSQTISETGFLGIVALMSLIYSSTRMMRQFYKALPEGWAKTFALGAWGGCTGIFCASFNGDYLFPTYHNGGMSSFGATVYIWLTVGVTTAIGREFGLDWKTLAAAAAAPRPRRVVTPIYNHGPHAAIASASAAGEAPST